MTEHSLLLLIPAYNEERRIEPVLRDYARYFKEHYQGKFQLVVVLNGCTDNTLGVVQRVGADYPAVSALEFPERDRQGRGAHRRAEAGPAGGHHWLRGCGRRDPAARVPRSGAPH